MTDAMMDDLGLATGGLLVRHLVMPNHVGSAKRVMEFIAEEVSDRTLLDIKAQYRPYYKAKTEGFYEEIGRPITAGEYEAVVEHARDVGLERLYLDRSMLSKNPGITDSF